jgi:hypothetical protein
MLCNLSLVGNESLAKFEDLERIRLEFRLKIKNLFLGSAQFPPESQFITKLRELGMTDNLLKMIVYKIFPNLQMLTNEARTTIFNVPSNVFNIPKISVGNLIATEQLKARIRVLAAWTLPLHC